MNGIYKRNIGIINNNSQQKLRSVRVAFVGCGLGSNIAVLAARTGLLNFTLIDGDRVEVSNLNRQQFLAGDVGKNKARSLAKTLRNINKEVSVVVKQKYLYKKKEIDNIVKHHEIIINTADFSKGFVEIVESGCRGNRLVITPYNVGNTAVVTSYSNKNIKIFHDLNVKLLKNEKTAFIELLGHVNSKSILPAEFEGVFSGIVSGKLRHIPQTGIASYLGASTVVKTIVDWLDDKPVPLYPTVVQPNLQECFK